MHRLNPLIKLQDFEVSKLEKAQRVSVCPNKSRKTFRGTEVL
jgi:hypothetical protein